RRLAVRPPDRPVLPAGGRVLDHRGDRRRTATGIRALSGAARVGPGVRRAGAGGARVGPASADYGGCMADGSGEDLVGGRWGAAAQAATDRLSGRPRPLPASARGILAGYEWAAGRRPLAPVTGADMLRRRPPNRAQLGGEERTALQRVHDLRYRVEDRD